MKILRIIENPTRGSAPYGAPPLTGLRPVRGGAPGRIFNNSKIFIKDFHGFFEIFMDLYGFGWVWMDLNGFVWIWMDLNGFGWILMDLNGFG